MTGPRVLALESSLVTYPGAQNQKHVRLDRFSPSYVLFERVASADDGVDQVRGITSVDGS